MRDAYDRVHLGGDEACVHGRKGLSVVHACKDPCHKEAVGYRGDLDKDHPHYLTLEEDQNLYLNLIDPPAPLFMADSFHEFLEFASRRYEEGDQLLIHCNQGRSRAPSLALLFLAKELGELPDDSYRAARREYEKADPRYSPGRGIETYLAENWETF